jgi:hypothetical protein
MEIAVIEIEVAKLQKLHDTGVLHPSDYLPVEVYTKGFKDDPEYVNLTVKKKELFAKFKKEEREIDDKLNDLRDAYNK